MATKAKPLYSRLYRYEDFPIQGGSKVGLTTYWVSKITPEGYWIVDWSGKKRWMSKKAKHPFAHDNEAFALASYIRRKQRQHQFIVSQLLRVRGILNTLEALSDDMKGAESIGPCGLFCAESRNKPKFLDRLKGTD